MRKALLAWALPLLALAGTPAPAASPAVALLHHTIVAVGANQSNNWSGYNQGTLEKGTTFHQISATWTVPTATANKAGEAEYSSTWIGIGGGCDDSACTVTDTTLIQAGTEQDVDATGQATYSTWWEAIPAPSVAASVAVKAGDVVHFDISEGAPELWTITIQNLTTGQSWSQTIAYTSTYATAEFIEETPVVIDSSGNVTVGPLPRLSTVHFDPGLVNHTNPALVPSEELQLIDFNGNVLATPSSPDRDTDGFNVCTYSTTCAPPRRS